MTTNGMPPPDGSSKSLGEIVAEVSEKASQLVREEIELAKAEVKEKVSKLTKGAAVAGAAGVFLIFGITTFFHGLAWFLDDEVLGALVLLVALGQDLEDPRR